MRIDLSGVGYNVARIFQQFGAPVTTMDLVAVECRERDDLGAQRIAPLLVPGNRTTAIDRSSGAYTSFETRAPVPARAVTEEDGSLLLATLNQALKSDSIDAVILAGHRQPVPAYLPLPEISALAGNAAIPFHLVSADLSDPLVFNSGSREEVSVFCTATGPIRWGSEELEFIPAHSVNPQGFREACFAGVLLGLAEGGSVIEALERGNAAIAMNNATLQPGSVRPA
jgi:fructose-1-phosphate kinase PfkB-like protein